MRSGFHNETYRGNCNEVVGLPFLRETIRNHPDGIIERLRQASDAPHSIIVAEC